MNNESLIFFKMVRDFLSIYLPKQKGASNHTIKSYKTTINQYLSYSISKLNIPLASFNFNCTTINLVEDFLENGEEKNNWSTSTRNQKLAAIKSFYKYAANHDIELLVYYKEIEKITVKSDIKNKKIDIFSESELKLLLQQPNIKDRKGFRDLVVMITLYDTGCRVQELLSLRIKNLNLNIKSPYVLLKGKGQKERIVPLMDKTVGHLRKYLNIFHSDSISDDDFLFYSIHNGLKSEMSQDNIQRIIDKYCELAYQKNEHFPKHIYCHMFRHSRATHLYRNGMPLALVAEWLGHAQLETTRNYYANADIEMKRKAINEATSLINPLLSQNNDYNFDYTDDELLKKLYGLK